MRPNTIPDEDLAAEELPIQIAPNIHKACFNRHVQKRESESQPSVEFLELTWMLRCKIAPEH